jgi:hypothetical protein
MELKKLEAMGDFAIVEKLNESNDNSGPIEVASTKPPYFARGKVITSGDMFLTAEEEIIFIVDNALDFGFGHSNIYVVRGEDIVCCVENEEEEG